MAVEASNVEAIFGTLLDEANRGRIDLSGMDIFWAFTGKSVQAKTAQTEDKDRSNSSDPFLPMYQVLSNQFWESSMDIVYCIAVLLKLRHVCRMRHSEHLIAAQLAS